MTLESFGYLSVHTPRLADWAEYGAKFLGLELAEQTRRALRFRMDDRCQRIVVGNGDEHHSALGFETKDAVSVDALAARLDALDLPVASLSAGRSALLGVAGGITFADPVGNRLEVFHSLEAADRPFKPGRALSGFRTGSLGMGHAVLLVERVDDVRGFYEDVLGFRLTDYALAPLKAYFFHLNERHHSLALIEGESARLHHVMLELHNLDDVGQGYDLAQAEPERVATTLGRHTNDFMTSFYARSPEAFLVEYGWGGRTIDPNTWKPHEMTHGPSLWGHDRTWVPESQRAELHRVRAAAAEEGLRAPVQVAQGNYSLGSNHRAWWEKG